MDTNWQTQYLYFNMKNIKGRTDCSIVTPKCDLLIAKTNYDMFYIKKMSMLKKNLTVVIAAVNVGRKEVNKVAARTK